MEESGETFKVKFGSISLEIKDVDHYHAAIKASHVLLVSGKLNKYSVSHVDITVCGNTLTKLYKLWKSVNMEGSEVPEIECERTYVNEKWFDTPSNKTKALCADVHTINECTEMLECMSTTSDTFSHIPVPINGNCAADLLEVMSKLWGFSSFKGQQAAAIDAILQGKDCFINMPTGGGKSLLYQLPAVSQSGVTIVVEPINALIVDQISNCKCRNIPAAALFGEVNETYKHQILHDLSIEVTPFKLVYTTPEYLVVDKAFKNVLKELYLKRNIQRFIIDECHCVSLWGREFRPSYCQLNSLRNSFPTVPIIMLTATSTKKVQEDVCTTLSVSEPFVLRDSYNKPNTAYIIENKDGKLHERIAGEIKDCNCSLVYGSTRVECEAMCAKLVANGVNARAYHGDMSKLLKKEIFDKWMSGEVKCLVCTKAFGMGVDKPNVSVIIHISMPNCMEDYYQETGRGGRNGQPCKCILYFSPNDAIRHIHSIFRQSKQSMDSLNKRYRHFLEFFYFCFQNCLCRRMLLLKYFDSGNDRCNGHNLKCDHCMKGLPTTVEDITELSGNIILCLLSMKKLNPRMFTLKQLANVITGKCNKDVKKYGYNNAEHFGCYKATTLDGEYVLNILVYMDVLRLFPPDVSYRNQNVLYIDLGPQFMYVQSKQLSVSYSKVQKMHVA